MYEINELIKQSFEQSFFLDKGSLITENNIQNNINKFQKHYPDIISKILTNLKLTFPTALIENWTLFHTNDRCIRFLFQFGDHERYIIQLSIFGFLSVYQRPFNKIDGKNVYGEVEFLNDQHVVANQAYHCIPDYDDFKWLYKAQLDSPVKELSIFNDDPLYANIITVADVLFTQHYI